MEDDERLCSCNAGCGWSGPVKDLGCQFHEITDFFERVSPGEVCPVGECPECGALAHFDAVAAGDRSCA
jgi:hypothetical protein